MAPTQWSNLPGDILSIIVKLLNSDVDLLRLRSVCSSRRSSLPTRMKPYSFPMKVPPVFSNPISSTLRGNEHFSLNYSTLYRLSSPDYAGDSSDGWLLRVLKVKPNTFSLLSPLLPEKIGSRYESIPEYMNLLNYRISEICKCYQLDFVDVNGSVNELGDIIRKVIVLWNFVEDCDFAVLILVLNKRRWGSKSNDLMYWKFGDKDWTSIDIQGYEFDDVIFFDGKCYAVGWKGEIYSFDSKFNMSWAFSPDDHLPYNHNNFVVNKSDLYILSKIYNREADEHSSEFEGRYSSGDDYNLTPEHRLSYDSEEDEGTPSYISTGEDEYSDEEICIGKGSCEDIVEDEKTYANMSDEDEETSIGKDKCSGEDIVEDESTYYENMSTDEDEDEDEDEEADEDEDEGSDEDDETYEEEADPVEIPLRVKIFRVSNDWECKHFIYWRDDEFFLSSDDVSAVLSTKDFGSCKGNCVYMAHRRFSYEDQGIGYGDHHGVFDFDGRRRTTLVLEGARDRAKIYWPPPDWLSDGSSSSRF